MPPTAPLMKRMSSRRRRRPSLDDLLKTHTAELDLGFVPNAVDDGTGLPVDHEAGVSALFEMCRGAGNTYMTIAPMTKLLETLGVHMEGDKASGLFDMHKLKPLAPAEVEAAAASGVVQPPDFAMDVVGFGKMLAMVMSSGDVADCLGGLGDTRKPIHSLADVEVKKLRKIFNAVDVDNDKELTHKELLIVFERWGLAVLESEAASLIDRFDVNNSGTLDFDEFLGLAAAAISLRDGDEETMETTIQTHFQREHAKVKSLATRSKLAVDAATLKFFRGAESATNSIVGAEEIAADALAKLGGDGVAQRRAREHVRQRLVGELDERLLEASETGETAEVKSLLARGACCNAARMEPPRETALLLALASRHDKAATALLDAGADASLRDDRGRGAVLEAALSGCLGKSKHILQLLVARKADVNAKDELGQCALLAAVQRKKVAEVDALLKYGADANAADEEGSTPLMKAAQNAEKAIVARLLEANPDVNLLDNRNLSARDRADLVNSEPVAELIGRNGGLPGCKIMEMYTPRTRQARASKAQRSKRNSRTGRIRTLSDSQLDRAHRASFTRSRSGDAHSSGDVSAIDEAVKMFADQPSPRLEPLSSPPAAAAA